MSTASKTLAIKARVYNQIRTSFFKKRIEDFSPEDKQKMFDRIFGLNIIAHGELNSYKQKRRDKALIVAERVKRGVKPKRKTTKEQYLQSQLKTA